MKAVSDFFTRVISYLPGCPEPLAARALVDSAIQFCDESLVLRQKLDAFSTVAGDGSYELDAPPSQQISRVMKVWLDGVLIGPVPVDDAVPLSTPNQKPYAFYTTRIDSEFLLNLYPTPDKVYSIVVEAAMRPIRDVDSLEDDLFHLWINPVVTGAMGILQSIPGQAFSEPTEGQRNSLMALALARKARIEGGFGRVRSTVRISPRAFA